MSLPRMNNASQSSKFRETGNLACFETDRKWRYSGAEIIVISNGMQLAPRRPEGCRGALVAALEGGCYFNGRDFGRLLNG